MDIERKKWNILVAIDEVPDPVWERFRSSACLTFLREGQGYLSGPSAGNL